MKNINYTKLSERTIKWLFILYSVIITIQYLLDAISDNFNKAGIIANISTFGYSDWFINFQAGFVRRGIIGELLLLLYNNFNIDVSHAIMAIVITSTTALILCMIYMFRKKGLSLYLLPSILFFGGFAINGLIIYRRDALMMLIIFGALYFYKHYMTLFRQKSVICVKGITAYLMFSILSILVILSHEASFFCFIPFVMFDYFMNGKSNFICRTAKAIFFVMPAIVTMALACIFKGNEETANAIWNSYTPYFIEKFGYTLPIGAAVNALSWDTTSTFVWHFMSNYTFRTDGITRIIYWAIIYASSFYLMANVNKIRVTKQDYERIDNNWLITILLIQFISLLPMFTVLSCDLGRIIIYWSISSFGIFSIIDKSRYPILSKFSNRIENLFNNNILLSKKWFYIIISLVIIAPFAFFPTFEESFLTSVIGNLIYVTENVCKYLF